MIFAKKENDLLKKINESVFPCIQGGPHNNRVAASATQLKEVVTPEFTKYILNVKSNAKYLGEKLIESVLNYLQMEPIIIFYLRFK